MYVIIMTIIEQNCILLMDFQIKNININTIVLYLVIFLYYEQELFTRTNLLETKYILL